MGSLVSKKHSQIVLIAVGLLILFGLLSPPTWAGSSLEQRKIQLLELLGLDGADPAVVNAAQQAHALYAVDVVPGDEDLSIVLHLSGLPEYNSYLYKEDRRLVVDLSNTINLSPSSVYSFNQQDPVKQVRNSQYRVTPTLISRVVLDLENDATPEITSDGQNLIIVTPVPNPVLPPAASETVSKKPVQVASEVVPVPAVKVNTAAPEVDLMFAENTEDPTLAKREPVQTISDDPTEPAPKEVAEPKAEPAVADATDQPLEEQDEPALEPAEETLPGNPEEDAVVLDLTGEQEPAEAADEIGELLSATAETKDAEAAPVEQADQPSIAPEQTEPEEEAVAETEPTERAASEINVEPKQQIVEVPIKEAELPKAAPKQLAAATPVAARTVTPAVAQREELIKQDNLVTLNFRDADLSAVLDILARKGNLNILAGKDVKGSVTVRLVDVPFDVALNAVLNVNGYGYIRTDNIIRVLPLSQLGTQVEVRTETFTLSYAEADKIKNTLKGMLTPNGKIEVDKRTNMLIITDVPSNLEHIRKLIPQVDRRVQQVLIEVLIVDSVLSDLTDLGITWFLQHGEDSGGVLLPKTLGGLDIDVGTLLGDINLSVLVQALVTNTDSRILANPKVLTVDNETANIEIIEEYPYNDVTQTSSGGQLSNITFKEIGTKLEVKPQITHDEHVILWVQPEQNSIAGETITGVPIVDTRRAETTLIVRNHQTIVLGGLRENRKLKNYNKVPFLGDLPIVKYAFRNASSKDTDSELLVFLTVHIVESPPLLASQEIQFDELANMPRKVSTSIDLVR